MIIASYIAYIVTYVSNYFFENAIFVETLKCYDNPDTGCAFMGTVFTFCIFFGILSIIGMIIVPIRIIIQIFSECIETEVLDSND